MESRSGPSQFANDGYTYLINNYTHKETVMKNFIIALVIVLYATGVNAGALATLTNTPQDDNGRAETHPQFPKVEEPAPVVPQVYYLPSIIDCGSPDAIGAIIDRFGEVPFVQGETVLKRPDGVIMTAQMTMYFNQETGTYSTVAKFPGDAFWCIINSGAKLRPAIHKEST